MIEFIEKYKNIILESKIAFFEEEGYSYRLKASITFIDHSILIIKDYVFKNHQRKYSFHWMADNDELICRWDNSEHWRTIDTFPYHKHIGNTKIEQSFSVTLDDVLSEIYIRLFHK